MDKATIINNIVTKMTDFLSGNPEYTHVIYLILRGYWRQLA